jgi:hypothetical protein
LKKLSTFDLMEGALLMVGVLLIIADSQYDLQWLMMPGILLIGSAFIMEGAGNLLLYRSGIIGKMTVAEEYSGFARLLWTYTFILAGLLLILVAMLLVLGLSDALLAFLSRRPGPAFIGASLFCIFIGTSRILGRAEWVGSDKFLLRSLPSRVGGVIILTLGIALLLVGLYEVAFPKAFDELFMKIFRQISLSAPLY